MVGQLLSMPRSTYEHGQENTSTKPVKVFS